MATSIVVWSMVTSRNLLHRSLYAGDRCWNETNRTNSIDIYLRLCIVSFSSSFKEHPDETLIRYSLVRDSERLHAICATLINISDANTCERYPETERHQ